MALVLENITFFLACVSDCSVFIGQNHVLCSSSFLTFCMVNLFEAGLVFHCFICAYTTNILLSNLIDDPKTEAIKSNKFMKIQDSIMQETFFIFYRGLFPG